MLVWRRRFVTSHSNTPPCSNVCRISYKLGSTPSLVVRLIDFLLVFASQKIARYVLNEIAEFIMPLRKEIKDNLTRQGMQNIRPHEKGEKGTRILLREHIKSDIEKEHASRFEQQHLSQWPFPPRQIKDFTTRVCARERNLLTFLVRVMISPVSLRNGELMSYN